MQAALRGAKEIGFTVVSISISLIAVFIPILLMGGIVGRLFREFAITLSVAILMSLLISLTATPMMCAPHAARARPALKSTDFYIVLSEGAFDLIRDGYERALSLGAEASAHDSAGTLSTVSLSVYLYVIIPKGFFPQQDTGRLTGPDSGRSGHFFPGHARIA